MVEEVTVAVTADTAPFEVALNNLQRLSNGFGAQLTGALRSATVGGRELDDVLKRVGLNLAGMALSEWLKPLQGLASGFLGKLMGGVSVMPFAKGGVVSSPSYFPAGNSLGLMGEAGPEAIMPLARGADGRLGVAGSGGGSAVNVVFNVTATDAGSFRKSEAQVTGMLARAVSRGARTF